LAPAVRRAIALRQEAAHAAATKFRTLEAWRQIDGRVRGTLRFHGAATGRWSGNGPQLQNLRREVEDIATKFTAVMGGDLEAVRKLGPPMEVVGDIGRAAICAAPGHRLMCFDYSGMESRGTAFITNQADKLEQWAKFDRTRDPHDEPYYIIGRAVGFPEETARTQGKVLDLAFGYGGGVGAYRRIAPEDDTTSDDQIKAYRQAWRARHPYTCQFWYGLNRAAIAAVRDAPRVIEYKPLELHCEKISDALFLFIKLPSGRSLAYPFAHLIPNQREWAKERWVVEFMDNAEWQWRPCHHGQGAWHGMWIENVVQAICRDLLADAMLRLEAAGYPVVLHVHDEVVCEVPDGFGDVEEFKRLAEQSSDWANGFWLTDKERTRAFPLVAGVRNGPRFSEAEIDAPVEHVPGVTGTTPPRAKAKRHTITLGPPPAPLPLAPEMVARLVAFVIERDAIRRRRQAGESPPWTEDPILATGHFCNVHREHDKVTRWITIHWRDPHHDDPDLWFALATARMVNEPGALAELNYPVPFDAEHFVRVLSTRQARGEKVYRTAAYKPPLPEQKSHSITSFLAEDVLGPLWHDREHLRPRANETLRAYSDRLRERYRIGPFLAGQIIADLKGVGPLFDAPDYWTFAVPGPGSLRGLNRVCKREVKASWSETQWHATLLQLGSEISPQLEAAGIARLDAQNLQNCLCEADKYFRAAEKGGKPSRKYKSAEPSPKRERKKSTPELVATSSPPQKDTAVEHEGGESAQNSSTISTEAENSTTSRIPTESPSEDKIPDHILADTAPARAAAPPPKSEIKFADSSSPGDTNRKANGGYPHGERETGTKETFYIYADARGRHYLGVQRTSTKQFPQYHWTGQQWQKGLPKGFAKLPYRLPELLDAPADAWVVVAAGEKDAETAARLGFVATTNSGGEGKGQWTPELNRWFAGKQRVAVMEDNDDTGKAHAVEVASALSGIVPDIRIVTFRELSEHGDLTDWVDGYKHGKNELLARIKATAPYSSELDEWDAGELLTSGVPAEPRQWLLARCFCRTFLSGLVAPGDAGKTTLRLTQAIELATNRELLGHRIYQRCRVLVISLEDDRKELHRRLVAICKHHAIDPVELKGWLFCRDLKRVKLATRDKNGERQAGPLEGMLRRAIARTRCDLLILDPFVKLHALAENDNADMDFVCEQLITIAQECNIGIDSPAHTHKGQIAAGDADARRGASAQRDAGRLDYTLTTMSEDEAESFGIHPDERKGFVRLDKAKANLTRAIKAEWFRLVSVPLGNVTPLYPEGDDMQAIERWTPPETWGDVSAEALNAILNEMEAEMPAGRRYSGKPQATDRAAWRVVQKYCPTKTEAQCREMIREWIKAGVLFEARYHDPVSRKEEWGLFVDRNKRPQY
jgi:hypothetical protein